MIWAVLLVAATKASVVVLEAVSMILHRPNASSSFKVCSSSKNALAGRNAL